MAFLLALALVVSVMSGLGLSVSAEQESNTPGTEEVQQQDKTEAGAAPSEGKAEEEAAKPEEKPVQEEKADEQKKQEETKTDDAAKDDANAQDGNQKDEPQAEPAAEEPAEPEGKPSASYLSTLSVEELYAYLTKLDDNNFAAAWKELTDSQKAEYNAYVLKMTFGDNKTTTSYEGGGAAASMTNVAGLVSNLAASQKALRNSPARAARAAVQAAKDVELSNHAVNPVNGLYMNKWITKNEKNTADTGYTIHLESYTTGKTTTTYSSKPCDIVLVLDQSGSMKESFTQVTYTEKTFLDTALNSEAYKYKDNLYVKATVGEGKDKHIPVKVTRTVIGSEAQPTYKPITKKPSDWAELIENSEYYYKQNSDYKRVTKINFWEWNKRWYYLTFSDQSSTDWISGDKLTLYEKTDNNSYSYTYSYELEGHTYTVTIEENDSRIPSANNQNSFFATGVEQQLYYAQKSTNEDYTRLKGLKDAVNQFVSSVESDAATSDVDHNIAIVGFASEQYGGTYYGNTEILTGTGADYYADQSNGKYQKATESALQSAKNSDGQNNIHGAINKLSANGGTQTNHGMAMASDIFANQTQERKSEYASGKRNKVVVLFTDGVPTGNGSTWNNNVANDAINKAKTLKDDNTTIYTIGIFNGADATADIGYVNPNTRYGEDDPDKQTKCANTFMHYVSSNYPQATNMTNPGTAAGKKGYYLTAADSAALNEIFSKIASEIGSSDVALNDATQTIDKMSAEFKLPDNIKKEDVKVYKVPCTGFAEDGTPIFDDTKKVKLDNPTITVDTDTVSVSGFDYSKDYVNKDAKEDKGYKLLIEFPVEYKNEAWFGGNDIASNDIGSGIYDDKGDCHGTFEVPKVNRAIDYEIAAKDQTIYVTNQADLKELLAYPTKAGTNDNYEPDGIKNKYVNITYTLKDATGKEVGTYTIPAGETAEKGTWQAVANWTPALEDCAEYTWTCTVTPNKTDGKSLGVAGTDNTPAEETKFEGEKAKQGTVHVLYPTVKAADKFIYWGESVTPADQITVEDNWTELNSNHQAGQPMGIKPTITKEAEFKADESGSTPSKDSDYNVIAKIGEKDITKLLRDHKRIVSNTQAHDSCDDTSVVGKEVTDKDFRIHVKVKKLTVKKIVDGNMGDTNQDFTFNGVKIYDANKKEVTDKFTLKHNWNKTFKLKVGDVVSITEDSVAGYETSYEASNGTPGNGTRYTYGEVKTESPNEVTVTYTNKKQITPPNGITTTIAPYAIMVVLAAGAGVYFVYSRRRRNH